MEDNVSPALTLYFPGPGFAFLSPNNPPLAGFVAHDVRAKLAVEPFAPSITSARVKGTSGGFRPAGPASPGRGPVLRLSVGPSDSCVSFGAIPSGSVNLMGSSKAYV